jgi:hypothetical protein
MRRIVFHITALVLLTTAFSACNNEHVEGPIPADVSKISLRIYVPKGSVSTYAGEDASTLENRIDTLFVELFQSSTLVESDTIFGTKLKKATDNDSIWMVDYDVDGLVQGEAVRAEVYANRRKVKVITGEIPLPAAGDAGTSFLMTGKGELAYENAAYRGTIRLVRDVAKLRINISKDAAFCLPSDLVIDYGKIEIEVLTVANQTSLFGPSKEAAAGQSGFDYINYTGRSGSALRHAPTFNTTDGGQIDSLYLNENYRNAYTEGTNTTQVGITLPTLSATEGNKTDRYVYTIKTNGSYDILRNYIYTLEIKVRGQSLEPLIMLDARPWNDVSVDAGIQGTYLTMQTSEIEFNSSGYAEIAFCTDAQAIYVDYTEFEDNNSPIKIGNQIKPVNIRPSDPDLTQGYEGQVIVDKQVCTSFGFQIDPSSGIDPGSYNFSGKICIKAGNIRKCISFVGQRIYDAHYIVGEDLLPGNTFKNAEAATENGEEWLKVSPVRLYTSAAVKSWSNATAAPLYLHLDENLTGQVRKGSVTVLTDQNVEKKIYIQQLPALRIGRFGYDGANDAGLFDLQLYTEQLHEYVTSTNPMPRYCGDMADSTSLPANNNICNGLGTARSSFDAVNYASSTPFNWQAALYQAINYCAYKNRDEDQDGTMEQNEIKWYLPSQAQLMAMWVTYESYRDAPASNFKTDSYWSATNNARYRYDAQYLNFKFGNAGHYGRYNKSWTRCVRNGNTAATMISASSAPNVDIDFTSLPAGTWTATTKGDGTGYDTLAVNATLYHKIQVSAVDNSIDGAKWADARAACSALGTGWRLPTQKELQAVWILKAEIKTLVPGFTDFANDYYWTATERTDWAQPGPYAAYMVYMGGAPAGDAGNTPHIIKTHKARVRCIREL